MIAPRSLLSQILKRGWTVSLILTVSMTAVIVAVMAITTALDIRRDRGIYQQELQDRGLLLATALNNTLAIPLSFPNATAAQQIAKTVEMSLAEITNLRIYRPDGSLLTDNKTPDGPGDSLVIEHTAMVAETLEPVLQFQEDHLSVTSPIISGQNLVAIVHFGFSTDSLNARLQNIIWQHVWQGIVLLAGGVIMAYLIARYVTKPLQSLADAARNIGGGNLEAHVPVHGPQETTVLAKTLDGMRRELKGLYLGLEEQVSARTQELLSANQTLNEEIDQRQLAEDRIKASLAEKEVLLKEINHRVKNNLQIISSLLHLQSRDIHDEQALRSFQVSQERIRAMALVHEKLYQSDDLARIDFGDYIKGLAADLRSSYGLSSQHIKLKIDVDNILLGVDTAIPCGVIVNELVANSLKHAFPGDRSGEIAISFQAVDGDYTMLFRDDGVGLPEDLDISHPSSLGLTIVNALTGQLGGTIDLGRNGGSEISITFPAK